MLKQGAVGALLPLVYLLTVSGAIAQVNSGEKRPVGSAASLRDDAALQSSVSLAVVSRPLGVLLGELKRTTRVELIAARSVPNQRVTVVVHQQALWKVMDRVAAVLSHSAEPKGYRWDKRSRDSQGAPVYELNRDARSIADEAADITAPRRKSAELARELWSYCRMRPEDRASYTGPLPKSYMSGEDSEPFRRAIASLSPSQIKRLGDGEAVPISTAGFEDGVRAYNEGWRSAALKFREGVLGTGYPDPFPNGVPQSPPRPPTLSLQVDDYDGEHPERATLFGLYLKGVQLIAGGDKHLVFHPLEDAGPPPLSREESEAQIDLAANEAPQADKVDYADMASVLAAVARAAKMNIYVEQFYKPVYWGARSRGIRVTKGRPTDILNDICREWKYGAVRQDGDVLLWSKTWAYDRSVDIPDSDIARWARRAAEPEGITLADRIDLASQFSFPQLRLTLDLLLPEAGPWSLLKTYRVLRFIGALSPQDRVQIETERGLPLNRLPARLLEAFIAGIVRPPSTLTPAAFRDCTIKMTAPMPDRLQIVLLDPRGSPFWQTTEHFPRTTPREAQP